MNDRSSFLYRIIYRVFHPRWITLYISYPIVIEKIYRNYSNEFVRFTSFEVILMYWFYQKFISNEILRISMIYKPIFIKSFLITCTKFKYNFFSFFYCHHQNYVVFSNEISSNSSSLFNFEVFLLGYSFKPQI